MTNVNKFKAFGLSGEEVASQLMSEFERRFDLRKSKHPNADIFVLLQEQSEAWMESMCQVILNNNAKVTSDVVSYINAARGVDKLS